MYVVAIGNPFDGMCLRGPFENAEEANEWADCATDAKNDTWWVMEIDPVPTDEE